MNLILIQRNNELNCNRNKALKIFVFQMLEIRMTLDGLGLHCRKLQVVLTLLCDSYRQAFCYQTFPLVLIMANKYYEKFIISLPLYYYIFSFGQHFHLISPILLPFMDMDISGVTTRISCIQF